MSVIERARQALMSYRLEHVSSDEIVVVLKVLRDPTQEMVMAGIAERHEQAVPEAWSLATENVYRAMIDAALAEAGEGR